ncbi:MAG: alpha/beta hydrolase [Tannerellaceae bacterium]
MRRLEVYFVFVLLISGLVGCMPSSEKTDLLDIRKESFIYAIKGNDTLRLDIYNQDKKDYEKRKPVFLFVFGGGFKTGNRAAQEYIPFFEYLAKQGFVVASIDYRTILNQALAKEEPTAAGFATALQQSIGTAVADLFDATHYILSKADDWQIDSTQIIAGGSSAGAITVLQAEYEICNSKTEIQSLPSHFNYAGIVAYAGAVQDIAFPIWQKKPCPILLFHGDADRVVPFDRVVIPNIGGLWGAHAVAQSLDQAATPYFFYTIANAGHEIASVPLQTHQQEFLNFYERLIVNNEKRSIRIQEFVPGEQPVNKSFSLEDFIKTNQ